MAKPTYPSSHAAAGAKAITPSDTVDLEYVTRGVYVGVSGNVAAVMASGEVVVFVAMAAGIIHPLSVSRINSTSTDATNLVAVY